MRNAKPTESALPPGDLDTILGGEIWPTPNEWAAFDIHGPGTWTYYWGGQYHKNDKWRWDHGVRVRRDYYRNGTLYTLSFEDTGEDGDYNDYVLQIAFIWKHKFDPSLLAEQPIAKAADGKVAKEDFMTIFRS